MPAQVAPTITSWGGSDGMIHGTAKNHISVAVISYDLWHCLCRHWRRTWPSCALNEQASPLPHLSPALPSLPYPSHHPPPLPSSPLPPLLPSLLLQPPPIIPPFPSFPSLPPTHKDTTNDRIQQTHRAQIIMLRLCPTGAAKAKEILIRLPGGRWIC